MFQYTKEMILHGVDRVTVETGIENPYTGNTDKNKLTIRRGGEYFSDCIDGKIFVTEGYEGKPGKLALNFANMFVTGDGDDPETAENEAYRTGLFQLQFRVKTPNQYFAEYASPNWQVFGKPILVGFEVSQADALQGNEEVVKKIAKAIETALPEGNAFFKVEVSGNVINITGTTNYMTFDKVLFEKYDPTVCDSCLGEYNEVALDFTITDNVLPFATAEWLVENLRFPTYPNIRYASASEDERPIPGEVYTEYSFLYKSPRPGFGGQSGVGQDMAAVTRHIIYVPSAEKEAFETKLTTFNIGLNIKEAPSA